MTAELINGRKIAEEIRTNLKKRISQLTKKTNSKPTIMTILVGQDPSSELYLKLRTKACTEVGIQTKLVRFKEDATQQQILTKIEELNQNPNIHGILIQYPLPKHLNPATFMESIIPHKDVEGFHPVNLGRTLIGDEQLIPCTPQAVLTILEYISAQLKGTDITIINHSDIVGKPLAILLLKRNATITVCHEYTNNLIQHTKNADILITATGIPKLITKDHIKKDSTIIDVGIIPTKQGVIGDVDFEHVKEKAGRITPVPGGVGPVTITCALKNIIYTYKQCMMNKKL